MASTNDMRTGRWRPSAGRRDLFGYFERLVDPFPPDEPGRPPAGLTAFLLHYSRPLAPWLIVMSLITGAISVGRDRAPRHDGPARRLARSGGARDLPRGPLAARSCGWRRW
jgi:hypothetical protein